MLKRLGFLVGSLALATTGYAQSSADGQTSATAPAAESAVKFNAVAGAGVFRSTPREGVPGAQRYIYLLPRVTLSGVNTTISSAVSFLQTAPINQSTTTDEIGNIPLAIRTKIDLASRGSWFSHASVGVATTYAMRAGLRGTGYRGSLSPVASVTKEGKGVTWTSTLGAGRAFYDRAGTEKDGVFSPNYLNALRLSQDLKYKLTDALTAGVIFEAVYADSVGNGSKHGGLWNLVADYQITKAVGVSVAYGNGYGAVYSDVHTVQRGMGTENGAVVDFSIAF